MFYGRVAFEVKRARLTLSVGIRSDHCKIRDGRELPNLCLNVVDLVHEVQQVLKPS